MGEPALRPSAPAPGAADHEDCNIAAVRSVGSVAYSLPSGCSPYSYYYNCGGVYYQPQYQGDNVTYVVVDNPG
jgi:hypothetical protein